MQIARLVDLAASEFHFFVCSITKCKCYRVQYIEFSLFEQCEEATGGSDSAGFIKGILSGILTVVSKASAGSSAGSSQGSIQGATSLSGGSSKGSSGGSSGGTKEE